MSSKTTGNGLNWARFNKEVIEMNSKHQTGHTGHRANPGSLLQSKMAGVPAFWHLSQYVSLLKLGD